MGKYKKLTVVDGMVSFRVKPVGADIKPSIMKLDIPALMEAASKAIPLIGMLGCGTIGVRAGEGMVAEKGKTDGSVTLHFRNLCGVEAFRAEAASLGCSPRFSHWFPLAEIGCGPSAPAARPGETPGDWLVAPWGVSASEATKRFVAAPVAELRRIVDLPLLKSRKHGVVVELEGACFQGDRTDELHKLLGNNHSVVLPAVPGNVLGVVKARFVHHPKDGSRFYLERDPPLLIDNVVCTKYIGFDELG